MLSSIEIELVITELVLEAENDLPHFEKHGRIMMRKDSFLVRNLMKIFGFVTRNDYSSFTQTFGSRIYLPDDWSKKSALSRYVTLRHELEHVRQFNCFPLGPRWWFLNYIIVSFLYIFVLPFFWTFRAKFEREAYEETFRALATVEDPLSPYVMEHRALNISDIFGSSAYLWMWNRKDAYDWAIKTQKKISLEYDPLKIDEE